MNKKRENWWRLSIKFSARRKTKSFRQLSKDLVRKGQWDMIPRKLHIVPDDMM